MDAGCLWDVLVVAKPEAGITADFPSSVEPSLIGIGWKPSLPSVRFKRTTFFPTEAGTQRRALKLDDLH